MSHCWNSVVALCLSCKICLCALTVGSDISHEKPTTSAVLLASEQQDVAEPVSSAVSSVGYPFEVSSTVSSLGYPFEVTAYSEVLPTGGLEDFAAPVSHTLLISGNTEVSPTDEQQDVAASVSTAVPPTLNHKNEDVLLVPDDCRRPVVVDLSLDLRVGHVLLNNCSQRCWTSSRRSESRSTRRNVLLNSCSEPQSTLLLDVCKKMLLRNTAW